MAQTYLRESPGDSGDLLLRAFDSRSLRGVILPRMCGGTSRAVEPGFCGELLGGESHSNVSLLRPTRGKNAKLSHTAAAQTGIAGQDEPGLKQVYLFHAFVSAAQSRPLAQCTTSCPRATTPATCGPHPRQAAWPRGAGTASRTCLHPCSTWPARRTDNGTTATYGPPPRAQECISEPPHGLTQWHRSLPGNAHRSTQRWLLSSCRPCNVGGDHARAPLGRLQP
eukprot:scaffold133_cov407-Prasinococcus_capsulatus_cf.AAC.27